MEAEKKEDTDERRKQITNRHIAKLLAQLNEIMTLPYLGRQALIKFFWYLSDDLKDLYTKKDTDGK